MYGAFGIHDLPYWPSVALSVLTIILIINAFNLIDGIDGLAATTGIVANGCFATMFIYMHHVRACRGFAGDGRCYIRVPEVQYHSCKNMLWVRHRARWLIGLISVVMAIKFIELNKITHFG